MTYEKQQPLSDFAREILAGIPDELPEPRPYDPSVNHAPRRKDILTDKEKVLALRNALRYFPERHHAVLAKEFAEELRRYGRIYMYRFRPAYAMYARPLDEYPARSRQAAATCRSRCRRCSRCRPKWKRCRKKSTR